MDYVVTVFPLLYFNVAACLRRIIIFCWFTERYTDLPGFISTETEFYWMCHGPKVVVCCSHFTPSDYHHYVDLLACEEYI